MGVGGKRAKGAKSDGMLYTKVQWDNCHSGIVRFTYSNKEGRCIGGYIPVDVAISENLAFLERLPGIDLEAARRALTALTGAIQRKVVVPISERH